MAAGKLLQMATSNQWSRFRKAKQEGYRSGLEVKLAAQLQTEGIEVKYETEVISYVVPEKVHKYHPDFLLPNGIFVESKGLFTGADRKKHLLIKEQHPEIDLRFVFSNSNQRLSKVSKTTYGDWALKNGFKFADRLIPKEWINETV